MDKNLLKLLIITTEENIDLLKMLIEVENNIQFLTREIETLKKDLETVNDLLDAYNHLPDEKDDFQFNGCKGCQNCDCERKNDEECKNYEDSEEDETLDFIQYLKKIGINNVEIVPNQPDNKKNSDEELSEDIKNTIKVLANIFGIDASQIKFIK